MTAIDRLWKNESPRSLFDVWNQFDRIFTEMNHFVTPSRTPELRTELGRLACDIEETDSHYVLTFDVPGIAKEDLNIELIGNQLIVSGERKKDHQEYLDRQHVIERRYGQFRRSFVLPIEVDTNNIEAQYENGVLQLAIPKLEEAKPKKVSIGDSKNSILKKLLDKNQEKQNQ